MGKLEGRFVLITGGSSGIGLATARLFRAEGARVAITGRDPERLASAGKELGDDALIVRSDAGDLAAIDALMARVKDEFGRLDVLFLNAAAVNPAPFDQVTERDFDQVIGTNVKGVFFTVQKFLPLFSSNASILVTTSVANRRGFPDMSLYAATKAALRSLVQSLALGLIGRGIRVNALSPGPIGTEGFDRVHPTPEALRTVRARLKARSPLGRFGTPEEVASVALFLASDDAAYVVGEEITVDGGIAQVGAFGSDFAARDPQ